VHETGVVCFENARTAPVPTDFLRQTVRHFATVPLIVDAPRILAARAASWCGLAPYGALLHRSGAMRSALGTAIASFRPDVVILQFSQMAQYVGACGAVPCLIDIQDAFSVSAYRAYAVARGLVHRRLALVDWLNWVAYEKRYLPQASAVLTLSEQDLWGLKVYQPAIAGQVLGVPMEFPPLAAAHERHPRRIGFVGSFEHAPNVEAVRHFLAHILPRIRLQLPGVEFVVAGSSPPAKLTAAAGPGVSFAGFVDDLAGFLRGCGAVAIPLQSGGGIKIKTLEALAAGAAVVSTAIGAEGTGARNGEHLLIRDTPDEFASAVLAVLRDTELASRLGAAGRALVAERFSAGAWRSRFEAAASAAAGVGPR
jgi:glycosyltransferase involved in cell wall biosynthesis